MAAFKAGFAAVLFTAFLALLLWGDWGVQGWKGLLLLIAGAPFSVWAGNNIMQRDEKLRGR
jgi:hypothetical protein